MRIIQLTDCHLMADAQAELKGVPTRARLADVLTTVRDRYATAERLIVTGDLAHDEQLATYEVLRDMFLPSLPRLRLIPGNHDERAAMRQIFGDRIQVVAGRNVFVDEVGGWNLIGLDSHIPGEVRGELGQGQRTWLEELLQAHPRRPTCLFVHHPPVTVHSPWLDQIGLVDAEQLMAVVGSHSHVRAIFCGHVHQERTVVRGSITIQTTPSTGIQFRPETELLEVDAAWPGFRVLDLQPDGQWSTWVERVVSGEDS